MPQGGLLSLLYPQLSVNVIGMLLSRKALQSAASHRQLDVPPMLGGMTACNLHARKPGLRPRRRRAKPF